MATNCDRIATDLAIPGPEDYLKGAFLETACLDGGELLPHEANPDDDSPGFFSFAL